MKKCSDDEREREERERRNNGVVSISGCRSLKISI
jgi:hypothetical protein